MKKHVSKFVPNALKPMLKKLWYLPVDIIGMVTKRDGMIPPRSMVFIGSGDFIKIGEEFKQYFIDLGNLRPNDRVLDVGCGIGRMAIPLTSYLSEKGEYWGFDIVKSGIEWCQKRITPKFKNFHFLHSDIYNKYYNANGKILAQNFRFPFENEFFDFVFLTSVFTHMLPLDMENYMQEISRVLKTGGKCLITFFLVNEESSKLIHSKNAHLVFSHQMDGFLTTDRHMPEDAVAFEEEYVTNLFKQNRLTIIQPILYGSWSGREKFFTYQDMIIAKKQ